VSLAVLAGQLSSLCLWPAAYREPQDTWQRQSPPCREAESGAIGHVAALEPFQQGGRVWSHGTRGGIRALRSRDARSGAAGHVTALEPTLGQRQDSVLQGTCSAWMHAPLSALS
jgi:hypothetical protein